MPDSYAAPIWCFLQGKLENTFGGPTIEDRLLAQSVALNPKGLDKELFLDALKRRTVIQYRTLMNAGL